MKCSTKPRGVPGKVDRNRAMAADRAAGVQLPVIAAKYGISKQRASQIIKREESRG
jgi:hypothetical protein